MKLRKFQYINDGNTMVEDRLISIIPHYMNLYFNNKSYKLFIYIRYKK